MVSFQIMYLRWQSVFRDLRAPYDYRQDVLSLTLHVGPNGGLELIDWYGLPKIFVRDECDEVQGALAVDLALLADEVLSPPIVVEIPVVKDCKAESLAGELRLLYVLTVLAYE